MGRVRSIILIVLVVFAAAETQAVAVSVTDEITFATTGQSLFGAAGEATKTIPFGSTPVFHDVRGPVTQGTIYHLDQDIPVETAQAIWQQAVDNCTQRLTRTQIVSIELPIIGTVSRSCRGSVTPTVSQCVTGGTIRPLLSATCCFYGGTYPNCTNGIGSDTITVSTNKISFNVGPGIGPKPMSGTTRPYDIGLVATVRSDVEVGIAGALELDAGSVDVRYPTSVRLETDAGDVAPGNVFTLSAMHVPGDVRLTSEYPNISLSLETYTKVNARIDLEYAGINYESGDQIHANLAVDAFNTADDPNADAQGRIVNKIIEVKAGIGAGLQVRVNTDVAVGGVAGKGLDPIGPFVLPLEFPFDITIPPKPVPFCEVLPRPDCSINPPVSTDLVEMLFRTPLLDTPAVPDFYGGNDFTGVSGSDVPVAQARNELGADGSVRNTTITGKRDALESSLEAVGGDLTKLGISDGIVDTDLVRLGVDIDGMLAGFGLPPGGANIELPPQLPANFFIKKLAGKRLLEIEANLVDLDAVDYLYFDQEIVFRPNLAVELVFSKPVQVRIVGAEPSFQAVQANAHGEYVKELPIRPDRVSNIEIIQPPGGVTITPRYSIAANRFENNLDWLINSGIQGTVGQLVLGGYIVAIAGPLITGVSDLEDLNFALGQFTPTFDEPLRFPAHDAFRLGGFGDPLVGTAVTIGTSAPPTATGAIGPTHVPTSTPPAPTLTPGGPATPTSPTGTATPVPSPTPTGTPTPPARPTPREIRVSLGSLIGAPGETMDLPVWLTTSLLPVAGAEADLVLPAQALDLDPARCAVNPAANASLVLDVVERNDTAQTVHFSVHALAPDDTLADTRLFSCSVDIRPSAPEGRYAVIALSPAAIGTTGENLGAVIASEGHVRISADAYLCKGDCNDDGEVLDDEVALGVQIGLGVAPPVDCSGLDSDASDQVTADELVASVLNRLEDCSL